MNAKNFVFLLIIIATLIVQNGSSLSCPKNPYWNCNLGKPDHINIHVISHSHNDLGWVKTVLEYYNGSRHFYDPSVKAILGIDVFASSLI